MAHAAVLVVLGVFGLRAQTPVILISIDTLRADHLSVYGYRKIHTPNIDAIAEGGVAFTRIDSQVPLTLPSHTSMLTSTYPFVNGIQENAQHIGPGIVTLASVLKQHGYRTAAFIGSVFLERQLGLDVGFDVYDSPFSFAAFSPLSGEILYAGAHGSPYAARESRDGALVVRAAAQWLAANANQPVFAFVHLFDLHKPYKVPAEVAAQRGISRYDAQLEAVDAMIGAFRKSLEQSGLWKTALIVLVADHGEGLGEHGEESHGYFLYQSTLWVPLLMHWPEDTPGSVRNEAQVNEPGGLIDVAPTILDFLHIAAPASFEGRSLLAAVPHAVFSETDYEHNAFGWAHIRSLREGDYQFIAAPQPELYNLHDDPHELQNLAGKDAARVGDMRSVLRKLLVRYATAAMRAVSSNQTASLRSLGYLSSGPGLHLAHTGPDPKVKLPEYQLYERALAAGYSGRTDGAIADLKRILHGDPKNTLARRDLAECYIQQRQYEDAREAFEQVLKTAPRDYLTQFGLGLAEEHLGRGDEARTHLTQACHIAPEAAQCRLELQHLE